MIDLIRSLNEIKNFKKTAEDFKKIVFYSEDNNYSFFFKNLIDELLKNKQKISLITSDKDDIFLEYTDENIKTFNIPNFFMLQYFFSNINCKNFIFTTPDLGNGILNKSPFTNNYIYIFHSLISTSVAYKKNAFKNYDIFFCPTKLHFNELKEYFENLKKEVKFIKVGYPKINELKNFKPIKVNKDNKILIAPTWGSDGVINKEEIFDLVNKLILNNYQVIFRPHPMSFKKDKFAIDKILKNFNKHKNFSISQEKNNIEIFYNCEYLVTDWSGAAIEFSLAYKKPSIFLDTDQRIRNKDIKKGNSVLDKTFENICRDSLGIVLNKDEFKNIENKINDLRNNTEIFAEKIINFEKDFMFNIDNSLDVSVEEIIKISDT